MKLRFLESDILNWANKYDCSQEELDIIGLKSKIQQTGYVNKTQLKRIAYWKSPRSTKHVESNSDEYVREITSWSFSAKEERSKIEVLTLLNGVSWPSASVLLHFFDLKCYPILDVRALWSITSENITQYSFSFWWDYVLFCREISKRNSIDMRTLDRALWQYSKANQSI
jgi:hypothetical protein